MKTLELTYTDEMAQAAVRMATLMVENARTDNLSNATADSVVVNSTLMHLYGELARSGLTDEAMMMLELVRAVTNSLLPLLSPHLPPG